MQDEPAADVIRSLVALSQGARGKFEERLAVAALELVHRDETLAPASNAVERARLIALLGEDGDLAHLNRVLCDRIRDGALTLSHPDLRAHLRATTMEKLAVDQPTYAAYRRALEHPRGQE